MSEVPQDFTSSDVLEDQFGPTTLQVLRQDKTERLVCTITSDGRILELSWVRFNLAGAAAFSGVHQNVMAGKSIGKAFRDHGVPFRRRTRSVQRYPSGKLPARISKLFEADGSATVVDVSVLAGSSGTPYADILEVYSPRVAWPQQPQAGFQTGGTMSTRLQELGERLA
jgi:hypothetical protein